jgi:glycosyltransferase involved in cell wall biosynthesis
MDAPIVSVCITTCNQRRYIDACLRSVLSQSLEGPVEILVGDDCSTDGTSERIADLANEHPGRLKHIRHPIRLGASENIQALLENASGRYIARLDGDDYWLPEKLMRQVVYLDAHPEYPAVYTNAVLITEAGTQFGVFNTMGDCTVTLPHLLRGGNFLNNSSVMFRARHKQALIDITEPFLDYRAHLLLAQHGALAQIGTPLVAYRVAAAGSMVVESNERVRELYWQAILSVPEREVARADLAWGMSDFLQRVIFRSARLRSASLLKKWGRVVSANFPYGRLALILLVTVSVLRAGLRESLGRMLAAVRGNGHSVMCRR